MGKRYTREDTAYFDSLKAIEVIIIERELILRNADDKDKFECIERLNDAKNIKSVLKWLRAATLRQKKILQKEFGYYGY